MSSVAWEAETYFKKAISLDDRNVRAITGMASIDHLQRWDYVKAEVRYMQAMDYKQGEPILNGWLVLFLIQMNRLNEDIGASIFLQNVMMLIIKARMQVYPDVISEEFVDFGWVSVSYFQIFIILGSVLLMSGLYYFIQKTKTGKAMRAVAEDKEGAALMGIDVNRIIVTTFVAGSSLAAAAGVMVGMYYTQINHMMGFIPGIKAFTAAVLGGIGNVPGAMLGGFFLGLAEAFGVLFMPAEYKDVIAFGLLVLVLIFRPSGILGEVVSDRD